MADPMLLGEVLAELLPPIAAADHLPIPGRPRREVTDVGASRVTG